MTEERTVEKGALVTRRQVRAGHVDWHVEERRPAGPPTSTLVLMHGAGASVHSWYPLLRVVPAGWSVMLADLPGHADSGPFMAGSYTLQRTASALGELLDTLSLRPDWMVGHSAGAAIAMQWRLEAQDANTRIAAINPALLPFQGLAGITFPVLARVAASTPMIGRVVALRARATSAVRRLLESTGSSVSAEQVAAYQRLMQSPSHVRAVLAMMAGWQLDGLLDRWHRAGLSLEVLLGNLDRAVPPARTTAALGDQPACQMTSWPDAGHLAHEEAPERCRDWLINTGMPRA